MIKVILERHLKEGKKADLIPLLNELRAEALRYPGYVGGETLSSIENANTVVVVGTWRNLIDLRRFEGSKECVDIYRQIEPLLAEKATMNIFYVTAAEDD